MRYVLGPGFGYQVTPPTPPPSSKSDVTVSYVGVASDPAGDMVKVQVPAYDPASFNVLAEIRAYLVPTGTSVTQDASAYVSGTFAFASADVSKVQGGAEVAIPLPTVPAGGYVGQIVLGFVD